MPVDEKEHGVLRSFASRVDRNDPGALNNLGVLYHKKGMHEDAIEQFKQALAIDPKFELARDNLWYVYRESNIEDPDVRRWKESLEKDPENTGFRLHLGVSYHKIGRLDDAERVLARLVQSEPEHCMARISLGNVLKAKGRYREALDHYLCVAEEMGDHPVYHTDLGEIYYNLGRTQDAIVSLKEAVGLDSAYWKPHFLLSFAYGDEGMLDRALEESDAASRLNPSFGNTDANLSLSDPDNSDGAGGGNSGMDIAGEDSTAMILGIAYKERGYFKEALAEFELALIETPDDDHLHMEIAKLHLAEGRSGDAQAHLLRTLEANPENAETYKILGCEHHAHGNLFEASACYLEAYRLDSSDADLLNNLGVLLYQTGLREDAERMFKKGLNRDLYHPQLNSNILVNYILKEDYTMTENFLKQIGKFAGQTPMFFEKRALYHFRMDKLDAALADIDRVTARDSKRGDALYLRGMVHLRRENLPEAVKAINEASKLSERFTGIDLVLVCKHRMEGEAPVAPVVSFEPGDDMIELLQASTNQGFEEVREMLAVAVEKALYVTGSDVDRKKAVEDAAAETSDDSGHESFDLESTADGEPEKKENEEQRDYPTDNTGFELLNQLIDDLKPK
jgi:tetratricopeptide (TPR) repeat protein